MTYQLRNGLKALEIATPATPPAGSRLLYPKSDGWYQKDSAGVESAIGGGGASADVPRQYLLFHGGTTGVFTVSTSAGTNEPANAPMSRTIADLSVATQMRLIIGQRIIGAGGTSSFARLQYATNGATQSAWADANASGSGVDLRTGTANTVRDGGWVNLATGAKIDSCYLRLAIITVGTLSTAPTLSFAEVQFK